MGRHRRRAGHLHAGRLRPRRDRLLPGQARRARRVDELRHLRPRLRRLLPRRLRRSCSAASATRCRATTSATTPPSAARSSAAATGCSCGRAASPCPARPSRRRRRAVLGFFLYMVAFMDTDGHDPDRGDGRALEVEGVRRLGPVLRRHLLPAVRRVDLGRRLARQDLGHAWASAPATSTSPVPASCTRSAASPASPVPSCSAPASASSARTASRTPSRATTSRWPCSARFILLFGWFGFNAASTLAATDVQFAIVATNTAIAARLRRRHRDVLDDVPDRQARPRA